jgi:hypothetical protein
LVAAAAVAVAVFLVVVGVGLGGALFSPNAAPTIPPTPNVQGTVAAFLAAEATHQAGQVDATMAALPTDQRNPAQETTVAGTVAAANAALPVATFSLTTPTVPLGAAQTGTVITITMAQLNGSGEAGTAVITDEFDRGTRVVLNLQNAPKGTQPAHIHLGTCDNIAPKPTFPLQNVVNGHSETLLPVAFAEIDKGVYLINVHTSPTRLEPYVACGAIH